MTRIASVVEGEGEVLALPILLRRLAEWRGMTASENFEALKPIRVKRNRFLAREEEFERYMTLAAGKAGVDGWVLLLLDADDDCPMELGASLLNKARRLLPHRRVSVVLANREFEAWFIGSAQSLHGHRGLSVAEDDLASDPERPRDAKRWLAARMASGSYGETTDQPAFAARLDPERAYRRCRSFRKLCKEWDEHVVRAADTRRPPDTLPP